MVKPKNTIPLFKVFMSPTAKDKAGEVLDSGYIGQGPKVDEFENCLLYTSPSPRDQRGSRMPSSA